MVTLFDFIAKKKGIKTPNNICYECKGTGHMAYECEVRKAQYAKLNKPTTGRLKPLRCMECDGTEDITINCSHIICNKCDDEINFLGVCHICSFKETRLPVFVRICKK